MIKDIFYIGIVENRFSCNPIDRIVISPLMEWDEQKNIWIDISRARATQIFPDKGLIVSFIDDINLLENQVLKFKVYQNSKYVQGCSIRHAKFSIDRNNFQFLWELLILDISESDLRDAIINQKIYYDKPHNSECLIALQDNRYLGNLKFQANNQSDHLIATDPENWRDWKVYQVEENEKIKPISLENRIFVDPDGNFGKLIEESSWEPSANFIKRLINRLREHLKNSKSIFNSGLDLYEFGKLVRKQRRDKAILRRLQEHESMHNLQQEDIDSIVELLMAMEPFQSKLDAAKESQLEQCHEQIKVQAQQQKTGLENKIEKL